MPVEKPPVGDPLEDVPPGPAWPVEPVPPVPPEPPEPWLLLVNTGSISMANEAPSSASVHACPSGEITPGQVVQLVRADPGAAAACRVSVAASPAGTSAEQVPPRAVPFHVHVISRVPDASLPAIVPLPVPRGETVTVTAAGGGDPVPVTVVPAPSDAVVW